MSQSNQGIVITLIDGDIIAYRAAAHRPYLVNAAGDIYFDESGKYAKREATLQETLVKASELILEILVETEFYNTGGAYKVFLTGKNNFRYDIAKSHDYKGNRKDTVKPVYLPNVREYLIQKYWAIVSDGEEADDMIAIEATKYDGKALIASIDKDFMQVPGLHYNLNRKSFTHVTKEEGLLNFYKQILTGDTADNIVGLYRVGPAKAAKMLGGLTTENEMWDAVVKAYDGDTDRVIENARLLWLRRKENELWEPPVTVVA